VPQTRVWITLHATCSECKISDLATFSEAGILHLTKLSFASLGLIYWRSALQLRLCPIKLSFVGTRQFSRPCKSNFQIRVIVNVGLQLCIVRRLVLSSSKLVLPKTLTYDFRTKIFFSELGGCALQ